MQAIFTEVTNGDIDAVRTRIEKDPRLVDAVASGAPKKFAGQSLLQVAIRADQYEIAELLLDSGADARFVPAAGSSDWTSPVLLDAVTAAVVHSRGRNGDNQVADAAFRVLARLLDADADVEATDSHETNALGRAAVIANDVLPKSGEATSRVQDANLTRIFDVLVQRGADLDQMDPLMGMKMSDYYTGRPVMKYLTPDAS